MTTSLQTGQTVEIKEETVCQPKLIPGRVGLHASQYFPLPFYELLSLAA